MCQLLHIFQSASPSDNYHIRKSQRENAAMNTGALGSSFAGSAAFSCSSAHPAAKNSRRLVHRVDCVLAPLDAAHRTSILTGPASPPSRDGQPSRPRLLQEGVSRMGRAFVGQVWDLLQQTQAPIRQSRPDAERLERLGTATTERAVEVGASRSSVFLFLEHCVCVTT